MDNLNLKNRLNTKVQAISESAELAENTGSTPKVVEKIRTGK